MQQLINLLSQTFEDVNPMSFTKKDEQITTHRILRENFALLEEQSLRFHDAIKDILEQIVFHRERLPLQEQKRYESRIENFKCRIAEFHREYRQLLRTPRKRRGI